MSPLIRFHLPSKWLGRVKCELMEPITYEDTTVPVGFITDGATVPRFLWSIFPQFGRYFKATVIHDYLLTINPLDRKSADTVFLKCLKDTGIVSWRAYTMYYAVRVYGIIKLTLNR